MSATAIFDIGKTNKKFVIFDGGFQPLHQEQITIPEIEDDDGYPCDDLTAIEEWMETTLSKALSNLDFKITKLNFSTYGATIVNLGKSVKPVTPMYNYLKPYPDDLLEQFMDGIGGHEAFSTQTASPLLGMLNSGLQIYWLKYRKPHLFKRIDCSLHLPQYFSYLFTGKRSGEYTTVGCHSAGQSRSGPPAHLVSALTLKCSQDRFAADGSRKGAFPKVVVASGSSCRRRRMALGYTRAIHFFRKCV